ncbi:MAG: TlpA family protein disulfide reductase [Bdellovibrionaceae bacterium]|nr:TlpA family protein disulfide reductase [Pseudobdellovibrionaceae bacterium]
MFANKVIFYIFLFVFVGILGFIFNPWQQRHDSRIENLFKEKNILNETLSNKAKDSPFLIINFWASWCPPCISETPSLIKFVQARNNRFFLIAISEDEGLTEVLNFVKLYPLFSDLSSQIILDSSKRLSRQFGVQKLPETFVYSLAQKKMFQISGAADWADPKIEMEIEDHFR